MKITEHQKATIEKIISGEIFDLFSFTKSFNCVEMIRFSKGEIEERFNKAEDGKTYRIFKPGKERFVPFEKIPDEDVEMIPASLVFEKYDTHIQFDGIDFLLNSVNGIEVIKGFNTVKEFLALWQYLKSEGLIFELEKDIEDKDIGLMLKCVEKEKPTIKELSDDNLVPVKLESSLGSFPYVKRPLHKASDFIDYQLVIDEEKKIICQSFIGKRIVPTIKLHLYKQKNYKTFEEYSAQKNLRVAYIGILVSILIAFCTFYLSYTDEARYIVQNDRIAELNMKIHELEQQKNRNVSFFEFFDSLLHISK